MVTLEIIRSGYRTGSLPNNREMVLGRVSHRIANQDGTYREVTSTTLPLHLAASVAMLLNGSVQYSHAGRITTSIRMI
jgi:hypothetical protein